MSIYKMCLYANFNLFGEINKNFKVNLFTYITNCLQYRRSRFEESCRGPVFLDTFSFSQIF